MANRDSHFSLLAGRMRWLLVQAREALGRRRSVALLNWVESRPLVDGASRRRYVQERQYDAALYAFRNSQLYRQRFLAAGISEEDLRSRRGWERLPLLAKFDLQDRVVEAYAEGFTGKCLSLRTSGSTGRPLRFEVDREWLAYSIVAEWRGFRWWRIEPYAHWMRLGFATRSVIANPAARLRVLRTRLVDRLCGTVYASTFELSDERCRQILDEIGSVRPNAVKGHGNSLYIIAEYARRNGLLHKLRGVDLVVYSFEYITPYQRRRIAEAFDCPVTSEYGSTELGIIAFGCPCGLQHISQEFLDVEVLGDDGVVRPTGKGEAIVTHFHGVKLPLIRYRQGDMLEVVETDTPCARGFVGKSISSLVGRWNDIIYTPNGQPVHPETLLKFVQYTDGIRQVQIREGAPGELHVLLEVLDGFAPTEVAERLESYMLKWIGSDFRISVVVVDCIPQEPSGKLRAVIANPANRRLSPHTVSSTQ